MADKTTELMMAGLSRAVTEPLGAPLHGNKQQVGLFNTTAAAKLAALRCKDEGWLQVVRSETKGKSTVEFCQITDAGLTRLLTELSPKQVLEDLVRAIEAREKETQQLLLATEKIQANLLAVKQLAEKVLQQVQKPTVKPSIKQTGDSTTHHASTNGTVSWQQAALQYLYQRRDRSSAGDCPLPELYRQAIGHAPTLTVGQFHDELRKLHEQEKIYLHPWTGPLYDLPEPTFVLMIGHEIAYYVNLR